MGITNKFVIANNDIIPTIKMMDFNTVLAW